jgi:protein TonB
LFVLAVPVALASAAHGADLGADTSSEQVAAGIARGSAGQGSVLDFAVIDKLPPRYAGADCSAMARKLKSFNVEKSEYETTSAYSARMAALAGRKIDGARTMADPVAFMDPGSDIASTYVADAGHLDVTAKPENVLQTIEGASRPGVIVSERLAGARSVVMSNAFGAKVQGTEARRSVCTLAFKNMENFDEQMDAVSALIPMTPAEAKAAKQQLAVLYIGTVAPPFVGTYDGFHKATLDDPHQVAWDGDTIVMNLAEVWLFNRATGKVYHKVPAGRLRGAAVATEETAPAAAPPTAPATMAHGGSVEIDHCKPKYPSRSKFNEETGTVTLSFWVSPEGKVVDSKLVRSTGFQGLDQAAREALGKCTFYPALENGVLVNTWVDVRYKFSLDE